MSEPEERLERQDLESLLGARRELGLEYESALVDSFADRLERVVTERSAEARRDIDRRRQGEAGAQIRQFVLGVVSLGVGVPITLVPLVAPEEPSLAAVVVAWAGIAGVNLAHARSIRPRTPRPTR